MKIFSKEQIYKGDKLTAKRQKITSTELMERAGIQIFNWLHSRMQGAQVPIHIFCGIGNNGGDGLVVARHLITHGYNVNTFVVNCSDKRTQDFLINYDRIKEVNKTWPEMLNCESDYPEIGKDDIVIDAVFGIGLNRPADTWVQGLFQHFRKSGAFVVSIDMPSGVYADKMPEDENGVVWANMTLSFASPKVVFFLPDTAKFTKEWEVLDIGLDAEYLQSTQVEAELIGKYEMLQVYQPRERFTNKGDYGHALIVGGSYGKIGATILTAKATLTTGAGLVTTYLPKCGYIPMQTAFPEAMVITDEDENLISSIKVDFEPTSIGVGIGMGTDDKTVEAFESFLEANKAHLVIDADGLNIFSKNKQLLKLLQPDTVLTPHPKELERLIGKWADDFQKLEKAKKFSKKHKIVLVIKGFNTMTVYGNKIYINSTGNQGLATGGTGDVLTGMITGLLAQGYDPLIASVFGVYLHGKAGDLCVENYGYQAMLASDVIDYIGKAYMDLFLKPDPKPEPEEEAGDEQKKRAHKKRRGNKKAT